MLAKCYYYDISYYLSKSLLARSPNASFMATTRSTGTRNLLIAAVLVSALVGGITGLATTYLARTSPTPQTQDFYLFARDLSFNTTTSGLNSDYVYSTNYIVVNKGDNLRVHFFNPTDEHHSFTIGTPYANNVTVEGSPTDQSPPQRAVINIVVSQAGTFQFHCVFHSPQMRGTLIVQG